MIKNKGRLGSRFFYLEALENRLLLSDFSWVGGFSGNAWNDPRNWNTNSVPNAADANVTFSDVGVVSVTMDVSPTVLNLTIHGNSDVTLNFDDTNYGLTVQVNPDSHTGGVISLDQTANNKAGLTISTNSATQSALVSAYTLLTKGDTSGSSALTINANTAITMDDDVDAHLYNFNLMDHGNFSAASINLTSGPTATVDGTTAYFHATENLSLAGGYTAGMLSIPDGTMNVINGGKVKVDNELNVYSGIVIAHPDTPVSGAALIINSNVVSALDVGKLVIGSDVLPSGRVALLTGSVVIHDYFEIGPRFPTDVGTAYYFAGPFTSTTVGPDAANIVKNPGGMVGGSGRIIVNGESLVAKGEDGDFTPGNAIAGWDNDGNLVISSSASDAFGTLTIEGDLDSSAGMTLDAILGEQSGNLTSNSLAVTGTVTLGGGSELRIDLDGIGSTDLVAGSSFTLLSAASISGEFGNLPAGTYIGMGKLPALLSGLEWHVSYSSTSLTISVVQDSTSGTIATWTGNGNWTFADPHDWSGNHTPQAGDIIEFPNSAVVNITAAIPALGGIIVDSEGSAILQDHGYSISVSGDIVAAYGQLQIENATASGTASISADNIELGESGFGTLFLGNSTIGSYNGPISLSVSGTIDVGAGHNGNLDGYRGVTLSASNILVAANGSQITFIGDSVSATYIASGNTGINLPGTSGQSASLSFTSNTTVHATSVSIYADDRNSCQATLLISGNSTLIVSDDFNIFEGSSCTASGNISGSGSNLTADTVNDEAALIVNSGASLISTNFFEGANDQLTINSAATFSAAVLNIDGVVNGNLSVPTGVEFNVGTGATVTGTTTLAGNLVSDADGSVFEAGDEFQLIIDTGNNITGKFSSISGLPELSDGLSWQLTYSAHAVVLDVVTADAVFTPTGNSTISMGTDGSLQVADSSHTVAFTTADLNSLTIADGSGNYTVTIAQSGGNVSLAGGVNISGTGNNTLVISDGAYTFGGDAGASALHLTIEASSGAALTFVAGQTLAGVIVDSGATATFLGSISATATVVDNGTLTLNSATQTIASLNSTSVGTLNLNSTILTVTGNGTFFGTIQNAGMPGGLIVSSGATQTTDGLHLGSLTIYGKLIIRSNATPSVVKVNSLIIAGTYGGSATAVSTWTGALDLTNSKLAVEDSSGTRSADLAQIQNEALSSNTAGNTKGIFSSTAVAANTSAGKVVEVVAISDNAVRMATFPQNSTNFGGTNNVDSSAILITATFKGDANLDGAVDIQDLTVVANHWQETVTDWSQGDFDNSHFVDIQDLTSVANNWQKNFSGGSGSGASIMMWEGDGSVTVTANTSGELTLIVDGYTQVFDTDFGDTTIEASDGATLIFEATQHLGTLIVDSDSTAIISGAFNFSATEIDNSGTLIVDSHATFNSATVINNNGILDWKCDYQNFYDITINNVGTVLIDSDVNLGGVTLHGGIYEIVGGLNHRMTDDDLTVESGTTLQVDSGMYIEGDGGALVLNSGSTFNLAGGTINDPYNSIQNSGTIVISNDGDLEATIAGSGSVTYE